MKTASRFSAALLLLAGLGVAILAGCSTDQPGAARDHGTSPAVMDLAVTSLAGSHAFCEEMGTVDSRPINPTGGPPAAINTFAGFKTVYATDFAVAGVGGLRNVGTGTITLAGVTGPVSEAWLYWNGPTNSSDPTVNDDLLVNGTPVTGINIGFSHDNCWSFDNTQSYRADVTALVQAQGNGAYLLAGLKTDPSTTAGGANTNGASLVVFFHDGNPFNDRDVVVFNGNDSNVASAYDPAGWDVSLSGIVYIAGTARIQLHVADGQDFLPQFGADDAPLMLNGLVLDPGPSIFIGNSVPSDNNGPTGNGSLWDIKRWDITSYLAPGPNSLQLTTGLDIDCLGLVVALVDLPAGAAPGEPAFFTGGGQIDIGDGRGNFGFNAGPRWLGDMPKGQLEFNNHDGMKVKSLTLDIFNAGMDCAAFAGTCRVNNEPGYTYMALVCDYGEPGHGVDVFRLAVWDSSHSLVLLVGDVLAGGNIQRHPLAVMSMAVDE